MSRGAAARIIDCRSVNSPCMLAFLHVGLSAMRLLPTAVIFRAVWWLTMSNINQEHEYIYND